MSPSPFVQMFPMLAIFLIMYFILIRPQQKQQKDLLRLQKALKKNDEIVTTGGIYGTIVNVKEQTVTLRVDDNVRIEVEKASVSRLVKEG